MSRREKTEATSRQEAVRWDLFQDVEDVERFVEVFLVEPWGEHLRQHEHVSDEDWTDAMAVRAPHSGDRPPRVSHLVATSLDKITGWRSRLVGMQIERRKTAESDPAAVF